MVGSAVATIVWSSESHHEPEHQPEVDDLDLPVRERRAGGAPASSRALIGSSQALRAGLTGAASGRTDGLSGPIGAASGLIGAASGTVLTLTSRPENELDAEQAGTG